MINPGSIVNPVPSGIEPISPTPGLTPVESTDPVDGYDTGHLFQDWWHRVSDGWQDFIGNLTNYFDQSQVGNNATAELGMGIASGDTSPDQEVGKLIDVIGSQIPGSAASVSQNDTPGSSGSTGKLDLSSILGSSAFASSDALQSYYELYQKTGNEAYLEKLIDNTLQLENAQSAREYDKMMSDTSVSRMLADIEKAGYNPWLALQGSVGGASSGSSVMAGTSGVGASSQQTSKNNNQANINAEMAGHFLRALVMLAIMVLR